MPGWTLLVIPICVGCAAIVALAITAISARFARRVESGPPSTDELATREVLRTRAHGQIAVRHIQIEPLDEQGATKTSIS